MRAAAGLTEKPAVPVDTRSDLTADPPQLTAIPAPYLEWGSCYVHEQRQVRVAAGPSK
jgi:hypothetical protein